MLLRMPFFVGLLCGVAGLLLAGWIAALCADWFHASSFEGASGYMVVAVALLGGAAAFGIGAVCGWRAGSFGKGLGYGMGIVGGLSLLAWGFARLTGDVPPTWDGDKLAVVAELKAPEGWRPSNRARFRGVTMQLLRMEGGADRYYFQGHTDWKEARLDGRRWTIPGHAEVFTHKGQRKLRFVVDEEKLAEFDLALPARPGKEFAQWSGWQPASGFQYRFCLRKVDEVLAAENGKYERIEREWKQRVASMKPGAPLSEWTPLVYTGDQRSADSAVLAQVLEVIRARPLAAGDAHGGGESGGRSSRVGGSLRRAGPGSGRRRGVKAAILRLGAGVARHGAAVPAGVGVDRQTSRGRAQGNRDRRIESDGGGGSAELRHAENADPGGHQQDSGGFGGRQAFAEQQHAQTQRQRGFEAEHDDVVAAHFRFAHGHALYGRSGDEAGKDRQGRDEPGESLGLLHEHAAHGVSGGGGDGKQECRHDIPPRQNTPEAGRSR
jgi:hypothetical protein